MISGMEEVWVCHEANARPFQDCRGRSDEEEARIFVASTYGWSLVSFAGGRESGELTWSRVGGLEMDGLSVKFLVET